MFTVLFEIVLGFPFDEFCVIVDVLLDLKEFFYEFFEGSSVNIPKFPYQDWIKNTQIPQTLKNSIGSKHFGSFEAIRLNASHEMAVRRVKLLGKFIHLIQEFGAKELLWSRPALTFASLHITKNDGF